MHTDRFKEVGEDLFGYGWQTRLAGALGMDPSTIRRWVSGAVPVTPSAEAFLGVLSARQSLRGSYLASSHASSARPVPGCHEDEIFLRMTRKVAFTGVDRPKPVPTVIEQDGHLRLAQAHDFATGRHLVIVRHPDSRHLAGYLEELARHSIFPATARGRHHHYTAIAGDLSEDPRVTYLLSTHSGRIRINTRSIIRDEILEDRIESMPDIRSG